MAPTTFCRELRRQRVAIWQHHEYFVVDRDQSESTQTTRCPLYLGALVAVQNTGMRPLTVAKSVGSLEGPATPWRHRCFAVHPRARLHQLLRPALGEAQERGAGVSPDQPVRRRRRRGDRRGAADRPSCRSQADLPPQPARLSAVRAGRRREADAGRRIPIRSALRPSASSVSAAHPALLAGLTAQRRGVRRPRRCRRRPSAIR